MKTSTDNMEWTEAIRLLHKFCPESKSLIFGCKELTLDNVFVIMSWVESDPSPRYIIDDSIDSIDIFKEIYAQHIDSEKDRVLVFPDLGWLERKPFVCSAKRLYERIDEGVDVKGTALVLIGGGSDVLFVFETSGKILLFDHHEGCTLAIPDRWKNMNRTSRID